MREIFKRIKLRRDLKNIANNMLKKKKIRSYKLKGFFNIRLTILAIDEPSFIDLYIEI